MKHPSSLFLLAMLALGCEPTLGDAFEEVRTAVPAVCKDYCEDKLLCEWGAADGTQEDAAYSSAIRQCTVECAWYMAEGAYVVDASGVEKEYVDYLSGGTMETLLECTYDSLTFRCGEDEEGNDAFVFGPLVESKCVAAADCLASVAIGYGLTWVPFSEGGGECRPQGNEAIESMFF